MMMMMTDKHRDKIYITLTTQNSIRFAYSIKILP